LSDWLVDGHSKAELNIGNVQETVTITAGNAGGGRAERARELTLTRMLSVPFQQHEVTTPWWLLVPGVQTNFNDTVTGTAVTQFPIHGGRTGEGRSPSWPDEWQFRWRNSRRCYTAESARSEVNFITAEVWASLKLLVSSST